MNPSGRSIKRVISDASEYISFQSPESNERAVVELSNGGYGVNGSRSDAMAFMRETVLGGVVMLVAGAPNGRFGISSMRRRFKSVASSVLLPNDRVSVVWSGSERWFRIICRVSSRSSSLLDGFFPLDLVGLVGLLLKNNDFILLLEVNEL